MTIAEVTPLSTGVGEIADSSLSSLVSGMLTEGLLFVFFVLGFLVFRLDLVSKLFHRFQLSFFAVPPAGKDEKKLGVSNPEEQAILTRHFELAVEANDFDGIQTLLPRLGSVCSDQLEAAVRVCLAKGQHSEVAQLVQDNLNRFEDELATTELCNAVLEQVACIDPVAFTDTLAAFKDHSVIPDEKTTGLILAAHSAHMSLLPKIPALLEEMKRNGEIITGSAYNALIHGALSRCNFNRAVRFGSDMCKAGLSKDLDAEAVVQLSRLACRQAGRAEILVRFLEALGEAAPSAAIDVLLENAVQGKDADLLHMIDQSSLAVSREGRALIMRGLAMVGDERAEEMFAALVQRGVQLPEGALVTLISVCAECKNVRLAKRVLGHAQEREVCTMPMFSAMMMVYTHARMPEKVCELYDEMLSVNIEPDTAMYGMLIKAAVFCNRFEFAREVFHQSRQPDVQNYMVLMRAAAKERNLPAALAILSDLEASDLCADTSAYNRALDACVTCQDLGEAHKLFGRMRDLGVVDVISYNTLLKGLGANCSWAEAEALLQEMRAKGVKPNCVTYNSLINAAVCKDDMPLVWSFVEDMERQGVAIDEYTCSILVKGLRQTSRREDIDRAMKLIEQASEVALDDVLFNTLLDVCVRLKDAPRCRQLLWKYRQGYLPSPSVQTCGTLMRAYGFSRQLDQAWGVWYDMRDRYCLEPIDVTFGCMIEACVANSAMDDAVRLFLEMKQRLPVKAGFAHVYSLLIKGFAQRKEVHRALQLYKDMQDQGLSASLVTFNTLIDGCARVGDMTNASQLFAAICADGIEPDLITYSTVIKGYCVQGDLEKGLQLFSMMQKKGIQPDAILFNSILDGCAKRQMVSLTESVLNDMEMAGIAPSNITLSIVVKLYGRCRDLNRAFQLLEEWPEKYGFTVNIHAYTCLMSACIANGNLQRAMSVYDEMRKHGCKLDAKSYQTLVNGCLKLGDLKGAVQVIDDVISAFSGSGSPLPLEPELISNVLFMLQRRQLGDELGAPLAERLRAAGIEVPQQAHNATFMPAATTRSSVQMRRPSLAERRSTASRAPTA